jgi:hypothetical protein
VDAQPVSLTELLSERVPSDVWNTFTADGAIFHVDKEGKGESAAEPVVEAEEGCGSGMAKVDSMLSRMALTTLPELSEWAQISSLQAASEGLLVKPSGPLLLLRGEAAQMRVAETAASKAAATRFPTEAPEPLTGDQATDAWAARSALYLRHRSGAESAVPATPPMSSPKPEQLVNHVLAQLAGAARHGHALALADVPLMLRASHLASTWGAAREGMDILDPLVGAAVASTQTAEELRLAQHPDELADEVAALVTAADRSVGGPGDAYLDEWLQALAPHGVDPTRRDAVLAMRDAYRAGEEERDGGAVLAALRATPAADDALLFPVLDLCWSTNPASSTPSATLPGHARLPPFLLSVVALNQMRVAHAQGDVETRDRLGLQFIRSTPACLPPRWAYYFGLHDWQFRAFGQTRLAQWHAYALGRYDAASSPSQE